MVTFTTDHPLTLLNTFRAEARARHFAVIRDAGTLPSLAGRLPALPLLILGGGSNILFTHDHPGTVLLNRTAGMDHRYISKHRVEVTCASGMSWDEVARHASTQGWWGPENLSFIPGTVGGAVVQNIGAYGSEIASCVRKVRGIDLLTGREHTFSREVCRFDYRTSIFKSPGLAHFFITSVTFLFHVGEPRPVLTYPALKELFEVPPDHPLRLREAVGHLRSSKLPSPETVPNAGSFFKNPVVKEDVVAMLQQRHPGIPSYPAGEGLRKIPAAWLIEQAGWKGVHHGACATWHRQPLVIISDGHARGSEIDSFARTIAQDVEKKFGIRLEREVITL